MHAIILAAGRGKRLAEFNPDGRPKCLLEFGGRSLLARQLDILFSCGVSHVTLVVGYEADLIIDHVGILASRPEVAFVYNPAFTKGSVLSLLAAHDVMTSGESVLVLDADVLFHPRIMQILIDSTHQNCYLIDQDYDTLGESIGFFKFDGETAAKITQACSEYNTEGLLGAPHEEALRDVVLAEPSEFASEDVSGLPWLGVDLPEDVERAIKQILPAIRDDIGDF